MGRDKTEYDRMGEDKVGQDTLKLFAKRIKTANDTTAKTETEHKTHEIFGVFWPWLFPSILPTPPAGNNDIETAVWSQEPATFIYALGRGRP